MQFAFGVISAARRHYVLLRHKTHLMVLMFIAVTVVGIARADLVVLNTHSQVSTFLVIFHRRHIDIIRECKLYDFFNIASRIRNQAVLNLFLGHFESCNKKINKIQFCRCYKKSCNIYLFINKPARLIRSVFVVLQPRLASGITYRLQYVIDLRH